MCLLISYAKRSSKAGSKITAELGLFCFGCRHIFEAHFYEQKYMFANA